MEAMTNEQIIRRAYETAERKDIKGWVNAFTSDGTFTDMSIGVTYRGPDGPTGLGKTVLEQMPLIRQMLAFNAYSEGWALYAEQLADELGAYETDHVGEERRERVGGHHPSPARCYPGSQSSGQSQGRIWLEARRTGERWVKVWNERDPRHSHCHRE